MIVPLIVIGLALGLLVGRRPSRILDARLGWVGLILLALAIRLGTQWAIGNGVELAAALRPSNVTAQTNLASLLLQRDRPVDAAEVLRAALEGRRQGPVIERHARRDRPRAVGVETDRDLGVDLAAGQHHDECEHAEEGARTLLSCVQVGPPGSRPTLRPLVSHRIG